MLTLKEEKKENFDGDYTMPKYGQIFVEKHFCIVLLSC